MIDGKIPDNLDLKFKEPEIKKDESDSVRLEHAEVGPSSLYGRVGDNVTYHTQGVCKPGYHNLLWHWAWKDLGKLLVNLIRILLPSRKQ
jgi:hypothetical protein